MLLRAAYLKVQRDYANKGGPSSKGNCILLSVWRYGQDVCGLVPGAWKAVVLTCRRQRLAQGLQRTSRAMSWDHWKRERVTIMCIYIIRDFRTSIVATALHLGLLYALPVNYTAEA